MPLGIVLPGFVPFRHGNPGYYGGGLFCSLGTVKGGPQGAYVVSVHLRDVSPERLQLCRQRFQSPDILYLSVDLEPVCQDDRG